MSNKIINTSEMCIASSELKKAIQNGTIADIASIANNYIVQVLGSLENGGISLKLAQNTSNEYK